MEYVDSILEAQHETEVEKLDRYYSTEKQNPDLDITYDGEYF